MKITKDTGISIGALAIILPVLFWFFGVKADKKDVEKIEVKVEKKSEIDLEQYRLLERITGRLEAQQTISDKLNQRLDKALE